MTDNQLKLASRKASEDDRRRLDAGHGAFQVCSTDDLDKLSRPEAAARRAILATAIRSMEGLGDLGPKGNEIAARTLSDLSARAKVYASKASL